MKKFSNKMDYLIYSLFGIILITIVSIICIVYAQNIPSKESIDEANQYVIIYTDHTHNTPIAQIDIGDDGSHIYRECKRTIDQNGNIILELKFVEKKKITINDSMRAFAKEETE